MEIYLISGLVIGFIIGGIAGGFLTKEVIKYALNELEKNGEISVKK